MSRACVLIFFLCGIFFPTAHAQTGNILGAEITYKYVTGYQWEVTLLVYRNCRGDAFLLSSNDVQIGCNNLNLRRSLYLKRESIQDITAVNRYEPKPCDPINSKSTSSGIEKHTFKGILDLDSAHLDTFKQCGELFIFFEACCRDSTITTGDFGRHNLSTYASIVLSNSLTNSSAQFEANPIVFLCENIPARLSPGADDRIDFDSMAFSLRAPLPGKNRPSINYDSGFSKDVPLSVYFPANRKPPFNNPTANPPIGFFIDPNSGNYIFTPVKAGEIGVYVIQVDEYRKDSSGIYKRVGSTSREILAIIQDCDTNQTPQIQIKGNTFSELSVCNKDSIRICFDVNTSDEPTDNLFPNDSVFLSVINLPNGASFRQNNTQSIQQSGKFCMQFSDSFIQGPNKYKSLSVVFEARDNQKPINAVALKTILFGLIKEQKARSLIQGHVHPDIDRNCKADSSERVFSPVRISFSNNTHTYTDLYGKYKHCLNTGEYRMRIFPSPWYIDCGDTALKTNGDSVYSIQFFRSIEYGVTGVVYKNSYCDSTLNKREKAENIKVIAKPGNFIATTDSEGRYVLKLPPGETYRITIDKDQPYVVTTSCDTSYDVHVLKDSSHSGYDFGIKNISDIALSLISDQDGPEMTLNQEKSIILRLRNNGDHGSSTFKIQLYYDKKLKIDSTSSQMQIIEPGHSVIRAQLPGLDKKEYHFKFLADSNDFRNNKRLYFHAFIDSVDQKQNQMTSNDTVLFTFKITEKTGKDQVNTYNDSLVTPLHPWIYYHIGFQNTQQFAVNEVIIKDTIPDGLQYNSLEVIEMLPTGNWILDHNKIWFFFTDSLFSDSLSNPAKSKGSILYRIRVQDTTNTNQEYVNRASIQFGFNPEKKLTEAKNTFHSPLTIGKFTKDSFCSLEQIRLQYCSFYKIWDKNHKYFLEISQNGGSFQSPRTLYEWRTDSSCGSRYITIPDSIETGIYRLRLRSSEKNAVGFEDSYSQLIHFESVKSDTLILNDRELCEGDTIEISSSRNRTNQKLFVNNLLYDSLGSHPKWFLDFLNGSHDIFIMSGESGTCFRSTDTQTIVIHHRPEVKWTSDSSICFNRHRLHVSNETIGVHIPGGLQYMLNMNNSYSLQFDSTFQDTFLYFDEPGTYELTLRAKTNEGCVDSLSRSITVHENPKAIIGYIPSEICDHPSGMIYKDFSLYPNSEAGLRKWDFGDGEISNEREGTHHWSSGLWEIHLIAQSQNGCSDTTSQKLSVLQSPQSEIIVENEAQCFGGHLFQLQSSNPRPSDSIVRFEWDFGDSIYSNLVNPQHQFQDPGAYQVRLILENALGCRDTAFKELIVYPSPKASLLDSSYSVCQKDERFQIAFNGAAPSGTHFVWHTGTGDSLNTEIFRYTYSDTGTFRLIHSLRLGPCLDTSITVIKVQPSPIIDFVNAEPVCQGDTTQIEFAYLVRYPESMLMFLWPNGSIDTISDQSFTSIQKFFTSSGIHPITIRSYLSNGCQDTFRTECLVHWRSKPDFISKQHNRDEFIFEANKNDSIHLRKWIIQEKGNAIEFFGDQLSFKFKKPGIYPVTLSELSAEGCISYISKEIPVLFGNLFGLPSMLISDSDAFIDSYQLRNHELIKSVKLSIWDLGGRKIFESINLKYIFSGFRPANGLYLYELVVVDLDGMNHHLSGPIQFFK